MGGLKKKKELSTPISGDDRTCRIANRDRRCSTHQSRKRQHSHKPKLKNSTVLWRRRFGDWIAETADRNVRYTTPQSALPVGRDAKTWGSSCRRTLRASLLVIYCALSQTVACLECFSESDMISVGKIWTPDRMCDLNH